MMATNQLRHDIPFLVEPKVTVLTRSPSAPRETESGKRLRNRIR